MARYKSKLRTVIIILASPLLTVSTTSQVDVDFDKAPSHTGPCFRRAYESTSCHPTKEDPYSCFCGDYDRIVTQVAKCLGVNHESKIEVYTALVQICDGAGSPLLGNLGAVKTVGETVYRSRFVIQSGSQHEMQSSTSTSKPGETPDETPDEKPDETPDVGTDPNLLASMSTSSGPDHAPHLATRYKYVISGGHRYEVPDDDNHHDYDGANKADGDNGKALPSGSIAGISIASIVVAALIFSVVLFYIFHRRKKKIAGRDKAQLPVHNSARQYKFSSPASTETAATAATGATNSRSRNQVKHPAPIISPISPISPIYNPKTAPHIVSVARPAETWSPKPELGVKKAWVPPLKLGLKCEAYHDWSQSYGWKGISPARLNVTELDGKPVTRFELEGSEVRHELPA